MKNNIQRNWNRREQRYKECEIRQWNSYKEWLRTCRSRGNVKNNYNVKWRHLKQHNMS